MYRIHSYAGRKINSSNSQKYDSKYLKIHTHTHTYMGLWDHSNSRLQYLREQKSKGWIEDSSQHVLSSLQTPGATHIFI